MRLSASLASPSRAAQQEGAGVDATDMFEDVGHTEEAEEMLVDYLIGVVA